MRDNRLGGLALVIAAVASVITMAVHPSGHHGVMSRREMEILGWLTRGVHGFAIASLPIAFLGALGLTRYLQASNRIAVSALVIYGFGLAAIMAAAAMSGFVAPTVMSQLVAGDRMTDVRRLFLDYTFALNQAFASVFVVAGCAAVFLWSVAIWRSGLLWRGLAIYGLVLGLGIILIFLSGHLSLDVHGFGIVAFTQSIWFVLAGLGLYGSNQERHPSSG